MSSNTVQLNGRKIGAIQGRHNLGMANNSYTSNHSNNGGLAIKENIHI
jgi:hypothetical protein